jgi:hypothetical protein
LGHVGIQSLILSNDGLERRPIAGVVQKESPVVSKVRMEGKAEQAPFPARSHSILDIQERCG